MGGIPGGQTMKVISERLMADMNNAVRQYIEMWAEVYNKSIDWDKVTIFISEQALLLAISNGESDGYKLSDASEAARAYVQKL